MLQQHPRFVDHGRALSTLQCVLSNCQQPLATSTTVDCRYERLARIPINFNRMIVNAMSAVRLCPAGVKDVHDMLVGGGLMPSSQLK